MATKYSYGLILILILLLNTASCSLISPPPPPLANHQLFLIDGYPVALKNIPQLTIFGRIYTLPEREIKTQAPEIAKSIAEKMRSIGTIRFIGPFTSSLNDIISYHPKAVKLIMGFPVLASSPLEPSEDLQTLPAGKALTIRIPTNLKSTKRIWGLLYQNAYKQGFRPTLEGRTLIVHNATYSDYEMELQLMLE